MKKTKVILVVIIVLISILSYFIYIKISYKEPQQEIMVNSFNSVSLSQIVNNYNNKVLDIATKAYINGTDLVIEYKTKKYVFSFENGILRLDTIYNKDVDDIFILLVDAYAIARGFQENDANITTNLIINSLYFNDSIKVIKEDNNVMYVIDTTKEFNLYKPIHIYNDSDIISLNDNNYNIEFNGIKFISPVIKYNKASKSLDVKMYSIDGKSDVDVKLILYDKSKLQVKSNIISVKKNENILNISISLDNINDIMYFSLELND